MQRTPLDLTLAVAPTTVMASHDFMRIFNLPRRQLSLDPADVPDVSPLYVKEGSPHRLWPIQSLALIEASGQNGLIASIRAGGGKTLIGLLLPDAMEARRAVYLVKPDLKGQLEREMHSFYCQHFNIPVDRLYIVSYNELSSQKKADILEKIRPDLIVADEAHCLKDKKAARTKRFLRYMQAHPDTRFVAMSGTITRKSIRDFAHLSELALRAGSPLPTWHPDLLAWAACLDAKPDEPGDPGALMRFCQEGENPRQGFRRRFVETPGVIATTEAEEGSSLLIQPLTLKVPDRVKGMIALVDKSWSIIDPEHEYHEEINSPSELWATLRQLGCGFYYVWDWPDGKVNREWMEARAEWNREVREKLKRSGPGMDTPGLLERAAERYFLWCTVQNKEGPCEEPAWASLNWPTWRHWKVAVKPPPVMPVWLDDFLVRAAVEWGRRKKERAIIWYEHRAIGEAIAKLGGFPHYGAGTDADTATEPVIVCSMRSQGTGKNLQHHYHQSLLTSVRPDGGDFEQLVARTHRPNQPMDEVTIDYFVHTGQESIDDMRRTTSIYGEELLGQKQRIFYATHLPAKPFK